ncbi:MAG: hypothetical protein WCO44_07140 [Bacteroidota bacterium]
MTILISNIFAILLARPDRDGVLDGGMVNFMTVIISICVLLLVLIFMRQRVTLLIRLWYYSLVYGRYSHEFLTFFKTSNLRSPINGCIKDEISVHLLVFVNKIKNSLEFQTSTLIDYGRIPFMTGNKQLFKSKGKPDCMKVITINDVKLMVAGYNETLQGMKMRSLFFFVNGSFVMGEFLFSELLRLKPGNLVGTLSSKYLNGIPVDKDVFYITDTKGNRLNYENNGFSISIKYFYGNDPATNNFLSTLLANGDFPEVELNDSVKNDLLDLF